MQTFEIKEEFLLDGKPFKILSGAIHYFRVQPADWYHSLYNLKALGFNTVETYVPWNLHEKQMGDFGFNNELNIEKFLQTAQDLGLYVILRPSPYICAEWEFGGFPGWLLEQDCRIRSSDEKYLQLVANYYEVLLAKVTPYQFTQGGPILMMQVENEYGSYGEDKDYLQRMMELMQQNGVDVPLVTSDGSWQATLRAGSMVEAGILPTGNFGSKGKENFAELKAFHQSHGKNWPLMCMEFWDGWFNRWGEPIIKRDTTELVEALREVVRLGSVNLYMFHGGTNFGFMNGCSARGRIDLPQITSYDYGAPLNEQGNPTEKYFAIQQMIHEEFPELPQMEPLVKETSSLTKIPLTGRASLFSVLDVVADKVTSNYPLNMEKTGQYYGYMLYRTQVQRDAEEERFRIIDGRDRAQVFMNGEYVTTQYQEEIGEDINIPLSQEENRLDILMENMGRVNYGHKLLSDTQAKGIRTGVMADLHFMLGWEQYQLDFQRVSAIDYSQAEAPTTGEPTFLRYAFELTEARDTYVDLSGFGKGIVLINGFNLGRFWERGPVQTLYLPKALLKEVNELVVFETEGRYQETIDLVGAPLLLDL